MSNSQRTQRRPLRKFGAVISLATGLVVGGSTIAQAKVSPNFDCWEPAGTGKYRAYFGYTSDEPKPVVIPYGSDNVMNIGNGTQPTTFLPGTQVAVLSVVTTSGTAVQWEISGAIRRSGDTPGVKQCAAAALPAGGGPAPLIAAGVAAIGMAVLSGRSRRTSTAIGAVAVVDSAKN